MPRFPVIPESELDDAQKKVFNGVADLFSRFPDHIKQKNKDGLIYGPYSTLFYTDDISVPWLDLAVKTMRQKRLTFREKELITIAVLSEYYAPYLQYAHSEIALSAGLTREQVQDAFHGKLPSGLDERESTVYNLALTLAKLRGPMSDKCFDQAAEVLGRDGVAGVAHIVSGYVYVVMLSNIAVAGAPEPEEGTFLATKNPALEAEPGSSVDK